MTSTMFARRRHALAAGLALIGVAVVMAITVASDRTGSAVQPFDDRWLRWMQSARTSWLTRLADALSVIGGPFVMVPLRLAVIGALAWKRRWLQFGAFLGATVTSELCIGPLKALIDRPRPPGALMATHSPSFPSGHAIAASVTAIGLVIVLVPAESRRWRWAIVAASFATVMAMSRTYLGAHWASDVIAGSCLGTGLAFAWPAALEIERARRSRRTTPSDRGSPFRPPIAQLRALSIALLSLGLACIVALHLVRRDLAPIGHRLSEYANGPYGPVMTLAFVSIGTGLLALGTALSLEVAGSKWSFVVPAAVIGSGAGMVVSGCFRTGREYAGAMADAIHSRASAAASLALLVALVTSSVLRHRAVLKPRWTVLDALAATAVTLGIASPFLHRSAWTGASQRLLWLTLLAWLMLTACRPTGWASRPLDADTSV
jgi:undecaprenyl-diphosphatase